MSVRPRSRENAAFLRGAAVIAVLLGLFAATGCTATGAGRVIAPGDAVKVHFTCQMKDGAIVASTRMDGGDGPGGRKSAVYLPRRTDRPAEIIAGRGAFAVAPTGLPGFEETILSRLEVAVVGMNVGEKKRVELKAERYETRTPDEMVVTLAKIRVRPKSQTIPRNEYVQRVGTPPENGQAFIPYEPEIPGEVTAVTDGDVTIRFTARPGAVVKTPFGDGTIRETATDYEIDIDAREGTILRSGPYVGIISRVDGQSFTVDYSHPFAGESLFCDVAVEDAGPAAKAGKER